MEAGLKVLGKWIQPSTKYRGVVGVDNRGAFWARTDHDPTWGLLWLSVDVDLAASIALADVAARVGF